MKFRIYEAEKELEKEFKKCNISAVTSEFIHFTVNNRDIQHLMNQVYTSWQYLGLKTTSANYGKHQVINLFTDLHRTAVVLGNFNYQVGNGGIRQWIDNGYCLDDLIYLYPIFTYLKTLEENKYTTAINDINALFSELRPPVKFYIEHEYIRVECENCQGYGECEYESDDSDDSGVITCWDCNGTGDIKSKNFEDYDFDASKFDSYEKSYHDWIKLFQIIVDHYEEIKLKSFDVKLLR